MLNVVLLDPRAKAPVVGHPGEDLGYDVFALEDTVLLLGKVVLVRTGIAVAAFRCMKTVLHTDSHAGPVVAEILEQEEPLGLLIRDRSSMAAKGIVTSGGVIDAGYRGEIKVLMTLTKETRGSLDDAYHIKAGDKIAQMVPIPVLTGRVSTVVHLDEGLRGSAGFGSTGA